MSWNKQYFCRGILPDGSECGKPIGAKTHKKKFTGLCPSCNMRKVAKDGNNRRRVLIE